jgi:hypothetical protein
MLASNSITSFQVPSPTTALDILRSNSRPSSNPEANTGSDVSGGVSTGVAANIDGEGEGVQGTVANRGQSTANAMYASTTFAASPDVTLMSEVISRLTLPYHIYIIPLSHDGRIRSSHRHSITINEW